MQAMNLPEGAESLCSQRISRADRVPGVSVVLQGKPEAENLPPGWTLIPSPMESACAAS